MDAVRSLSALAIHLYGHISKTVLLFSAIQVMPDHCTCIAYILYLMAEMPRLVSGKEVKFSLFSTECFVRIVYRRDK